VQRLASTEGIRVVGTVLVLAIDANVGVAFVKACFCHEVPLASLTERPTPVPMEFGTISLVDFPRACNSFVRTTRALSPWMAFRETFRFDDRVIVIVYGLKNVAGILVEVLQMAFINGNCVDLEDTSTGQCSGGVIIGIVIGIKEPHRVRILFSSLVLEGRIKHVFTQILSAFVNLFERLALGCVVIQTSGARVDGA